MVNDSIKVKFKKQKITCIHKITANEEGGSPPRPRFHSKIDPAAKQLIKLTSLTHCTGGRKGLKVDSLNKRWCWLTDSLLSESRSRTQWPDS